MPDKEAPRQLKCTCAYPGAPSPHCEIHCSQYVAKMLAEPAGESVPRSTPPSKQHCTCVYPALRDRCEVHQAQPTPSTELNYADQLASIPVRIDPTMPMF